MPALSDVPTVALAIQQAVAPVFLLTGIGSILGVLTNRLGRAVDRSRRLQEMPVEQVRQRSRQEIRYLDKRIRYIRLAITLCTLSALCICLSIAVLFIAVQLGMDLSGGVALLFVTAMLALISGLLCFLSEIALATKIVDRSPS